MVTVYIGKSGNGDAILYFWHCIELLWWLINGGHVGIQLTFRTLRITRGDRMFRYDVVALFNWIPRREENEFGSG